MIVFWFSVALFRESYNSYHSYIPMNYTSRDRDCCYNTSHTQGRARQGREGKGREGKGREGKGKEGKRREVQAY